MAKQPKPKPGQPAHQQPRVPGKSVIGKGGGGGASGGKPVRVPVKK